jgi:hypothetical protein
MFWADNGHVLEQQSVGTAHSGFCYVRSVVAEVTMVILIICEE